MAIRFLDEQPEEKPMSPKVKFLDEGQSIPEPKLQNVSTLDNVLKASALGLNRAEERVTERGKLDFAKSLGMLTSGSGLEKTLGTLEVISDPFKRLEAAMANPILEAQKGEIKQILPSVVEGLRGQKVGEFGDVYVAAGVPEPIANGLGLTTDIALGGAVIEQGIKTLQKGLLKGLDKLSLKGAEALLEGVDRAEEASKLATNNFWSRINDVKVNPDALLEETAKLPKQVIEALEDESGKTIESLIETGTLADLRLIKQNLARLRSATFTGIETLAKNKIKRAYGSVSNLIDDTLKNAGMTEELKDLKDVNLAAEKAIEAQEIVRSVLRTKKGEVKAFEAAEKFRKFKGADFKRRLGELTKQSKLARRKIEEGTQIMKRVLGKKSRAAIVAGVGRAGLFTAAGAVAGRQVFRD